MVHGIMNALPPAQPSQESIDALCAYVEAGLPRRLAANTVGLLEEDLQRWIAEEPRREALLGAAEAKFQLRCMESILSAQQGGKGAANIRAIMWLLESRFPEQFGKKKAAKQAKEPAPKPPLDSMEPAAHCAEKAGNTIPFSPETVIATPAAIPTASNLRATAKNPAPGRNEKCPCASGFKYKHCCGATNARARRGGLHSAATPEELAAA